ncbi:hypothetical protein A9Q86_09650 [Flavobacteriales bacterium 33_180_T64]|nr:hypothetical protein A9Q86_09650 [Flavobacteriales bacterium 33_180_T64]
MKTNFYFILRIGIIGYLIYVLVQVVLIAFDINEALWSTINGHLIASTILVFVLLIIFLNTKKEKSSENQLSTTSENLNAPPYNQYEDKLHFMIYQQNSKTWWFDNDGDKHNHSTIYANLRFYEDGTVIGIRSTKIPKLNIPDSFTMKGDWTVDKNIIHLNLEKTGTIDDTIKIDISEYEERQMKYYGEIADDNSLIKAGKFQGIIQGDTITIGNHLFSKLTVETLITTTSECTYNQV